MHDFILERQRRKDARYTKLRKMMYFDLMEVVTGKTRNTIKTQMYRKGILSNDEGFKEYLDWFYKSKSPKEKHSKTRISKYPETLQSIANKLGVSRQTIHQRIKNGETFEQASSITRQNARNKGKYFSKKS